MNGTGIIGELSCDDLEQGRLACAIYANKSNSFTFKDLHRYIGQYDVYAIVFTDIG
jgi:hypothetical protein